MRLSELSRVSRVSPATIKFYLREGLLPPGEPTGSRRLAEYGQSHVHRLRLIRALTEVGGLPLGAIRDVLAAIDDPGLGMHDVLGVAHSALAINPKGATRSTDLHAARSEIDNYLAGLGWHVPAVQAPARDALAAALVALRQLGWRCETDIFTPYARLADRLAERELDIIPTDAPRDRTVEAVVVGTVVFETALVALRRLAQAHHSARRLGEPP
jgi:DNA-binding transcriptional MerR regulator